MSKATDLLAEFDAEFATTRKFLELVPDDKLTWKPHEKSMPLGQLAWHISDFPEWCRDILKKDELNMNEEEGKQMAAAAKDKKRADILARFDKVLPEAREALAGTADDRMAAHWKMEWSGQTVIDEPRGDVVRKWVFSHMVHHRAQLGVYLRLNNIPIPGSYGPSADELGG